MPFDDSEVLETYNEFQECLRSLSNGKVPDPLVFLFVGTENSEGVSWCPYCEKLKGIWEDLKRTQAKRLPENGCLINVYVGKRDEWIGKPENPFKTDPQLKIEFVPTMIRWGTKKKRLSGKKINSSANILALME